MENAPGKTKTVPWVGTDPSTQAQSESQPESKNKDSNQEKSVAHQKVDSSTPGRPVMPHTKHGLNGGVQGQWMGSSTWAGKEEPLA